ncbi:hypothetical protein COOONC_08960, partial [Cooperia oncophora]
LHNIFQRQCLEGYTIPSSDCITYQVCYNGKYVAANCGNISASIPDVKAQGRFSTLHQKSVVVGNHGNARPTPKCNVDTERKSWTRIRHHVTVV